MNFGTFQRSVAKMCRELGFEVKTDAEDRGVRNVTLMLEDY
jgi:hypothetical protein